MSNYNIKDLRAKSMYEKIGNNTIHIIAIIELENSSYLLYEDVDTKKWWVERITQRTLSDNIFSGYMLESIEDDKLWSRLIQIVAKNKLAS